MRRRRCRGREKVRSAGGVETREREKTFGEIPEGFVRRFHERMNAALSLLVLIDRSQRLASVKHCS